MAEAVGDDDYGEDPTVRGEPGVCFQSRVLGDPRALSVVLAGAAARARGGAQLQAVHCARFLCSSV